MHVLAVDPDPERDPIRDFDALTSELERFDPELAARPMVIGLSKSDLPDTREIEAELAEAMRERGRGDVYTFSAVTGDGLEALLNALEGALREHPDRPDPRAEPLD